MNMFVHKFFLVISLGWILRKGVWVNRIGGQGLQGGRGTNPFRIDAVYIYNPSRGP